MNSFLILLSTISLIFLLTGCSKLIHYHPAPPKNMRATEEEKTALKELEQTASSSKTALFNKEKVMAEYLKISKRDGVDETEAIIIAQSEMLFRNLEEKYQIGEPTITEETDTAYIILFPAIHKHMATKIEPSLNAVIHRESGAITFSP